MRFARALELFLLPPACMACGGRLVPPSSPRVLCSGCDLRLVPPPPPRCARCDHPLGTGRESPAPCAECAGWPPALESARTAVLLEPAAARLVHALKYGGWRRGAEPMAERMARCLPRRDAPLLVPVPTTRGRMRRRGYNQAAEIAMVLAPLTGIPCHELLERRGEGASQVGLHPSGRMGNVHGVFRMADPGPEGRPGPRGADVILIDDVLTTGATAGEAARVLASGGARSVTLLAFARAIPGRDR